jgi:hypothetical protein
MLVYLTDVRGEGVVIIQAYRIRLIQAATGVPRQRRWPCAAVCHRLSPPLVCGRHRLLRLPPAARLAFLRPGLFGSRMRPLKTQFLRRLTLRTAMISLRKGLMAKQR